MLVLFSIVCFSAHCVMLKVVPVSLLTIALAKKDFMASHAQKGADAIADTAKTVWYLLYISFLAVLSVHENI